MASWLVPLSPYRGIRVRPLAGDIVLCFGAGLFTLTMPLSIQEYKIDNSGLYAGGNPAMD